MPRGDKSKYTDKQERKADHIAEGYEKRGVPEKEAERRAWATVNKDDGGGKKPDDSSANARRRVTDRDGRRSCIWTVSLSKTTAFDNLPQRPYFAVAGPEGGPPADSQLDAVAVPDQHLDSLAAEHRFRARS